MLEVKQPLSVTALRALLKQESQATAWLKTFIERKAKIADYKGYWSLEKESEYIDKQLSIQLTRLNKINRILIEHGNRIED